MHTSYAELAYFDELPRAHDYEPPKPTRYEADLTEAQRLAKLGQITEARRIVRDLIEFHYVDIVYSGPEFVEHCKKMGRPVPDAETVAEWDRAYGPWSRFYDELYALYVDPARGPSYEICQRGAET